MKTPPASSSISDRHYDNRAQASYPIAFSHPISVITGLVPVIHVDGRDKPDDDETSLVMAHGRNKYQARGNRGKVRQVLMQEWDPIGVCDVPEAQDEYDSYVGRIYVMLMDERAPAEMITAYLYQTATEDMGISPGSWLALRSARAAQALINLRPEFELH